MKPLRGKSTILFGLFYVLTVYSHAAEPTSAQLARGRLAIKPLAGMLDILDVPTPEGVIGVRRCDFLATSTTSVQLSLRAINQRAVKQIATISINTRELSQSGVNGTFYVAFSALGGDETTLDRLLSVGIGTEGERKYERVKDLKVPSGMRFWQGTNRSKEVVVRAGDEAAVWGLAWTRPRDSDKPKSVQDIIADAGKGPFESFDPRKIIEKVRSDDGLFVILVTVSAK